MIARGTQGQLSDDRVLCVVCSRPIDAQKVFHALTSGEVAKYCSHRCRDRAKQERYWERKLSRRPVKLGSAE